MAKEIVTGAESNDGLFRLRRDVRDSTSSRGIGNVLLFMAEAGFDAFIDMFQEDAACDAPDGAEARERLLGRARDIDRIVEVLGLHGGPESMARIPSYEEQARTWLDQNEPDVEVLEVTLD